MTLKTYGQLKTKLNMDLDLETEDIIQPDEMLGYFNEAIDEAESHIHTLGLEDEYFLAKSTISLVQGTSEYPLPTDIYANKIKGITYSNGSKVYPLKRVRGLQRFVDIAETLQYNESTDFYRYLILNQAVDTVRIELYPPSRETLANALTLWYIRNANVLVDDDSKCDIPEFSNFILQYVKWRCYEKALDPRSVEAKAELERVRALMVDTLTNMVPDDDSEIPADFQHYEDMT